MNRLFLMLVLFGVLLGLAGQGAASAMLPSAGVIATGPTSLAPDCMAMMAEKGSKKPCDDMKPACFAAMSSVPAITLAGDPFAFTAPPAIRRAAPFATARRLAGRSFAPEPEPPIHLI